MNDKNDTKTIVICATQRSGSTVLCDDLTRHQMGFPEERFIGIANSIRTSNLENLDKKINEVHKTCCNNDTKIAAVKIMADYAGHVNKALDYYYKVSTPTASWGSLFRFYSDACWVMQNRGNYVNQALSRIISRKTGINHLIESDQGNFVPGKFAVQLPADYADDIKINSKEIELEIVKIARENGIWEEFFTRHKISPIYLSYEKHGDDETGVKEIAKHVNYKLPGMVRSLNVRKLPSVRSRIEVSRYLESGFEDFFYNKG